MQINGGSAAAHAMRSTRRLAMMTHRENGRDLDNSTDTKHTFFRGNAPLVLQRRLSKTHRV